ncbi:MAG TPA: ExbD/TolR family protein [Candidatus Binatia bacterium]|nr:ExbD/TolR family protein [Candidatus Binatia bacterium]
MNPAAPRGRKRRLASEINVVPYIDVMLVLLIIFMVTAPLLTQGVQVQLPETGAEPLPGEGEQYTLTVDARGRFTFDVGTEQAKPLSDEELVRRVGAIVRNKPGAVILLRGDASVDYGRVAVAMSLLQQAGATKIGFVTDPVPVRPPDAKKQG